MNKIQIEKLKEIIKEEETNYSFNDFVFNYINEEDLTEIEDIDQLKTYLEELNQDYEITEEEIIYYSNAIEYLKENDPSLMDSVEIALEYGFELKDINSEKLASLLKSQNNLEDYSNFLDAVITEMEQYFEEE